MRQHLLGSILGQAALALRDRYRLLTAARESLGTLANDQLAGAIVTRLVADGGTFVDVGAHIGSVVAEVKRHRPDARVVAFEAIPEKAVRLRAKFRDIRVECCALSDREGTSSFFIDLAQSGYSSLAEGRENVQEIEVPLRRLDGFGITADVVKIDVEGAELGVLRGATAMLERSRPVVMFESAPEELLGYDKASLWAFLDDLGYAIYVPNRLAHQAPGLTLEGFVDSHQYPRRTTNYFAVPAERREETRRRTRQILKLDRNGT